MKAGTVLYTYNMRYRPLDFGTAPDGWVDYLPDKSRWGWIVYPRQLTDDEIYEYELEPVLTDETDYNDKKGGKDEKMEMPCMRRAI